MDKPPTVKIERMIQTEPFQRSSSLSKEGTIEHDG
jgi:hypothetical protein